VIKIKPTLLLALLATGIGTLGTISTIYVSNRLTPGEDIPVGKLIMAGSVMAIGVGIGIHLITQKTESV